MTMAALDAVDDSLKNMPYWKNSEHEDQMDLSPEHSTSRPGQSSGNIPSPGQKLPAPRPTTPPASASTRPSLPQTSKNASTMTLSSILGVLAFRIVVRLRIILMVLVPLLLLPLLIYYPDKIYINCLYGLLVIDLFWVLGVVPNATTALLPIALFPMLGVLHSNETCVLYLSSESFALFAILSLSLTIIRCGLHKRCALMIILMTGTSPAWLLLGCILSSTFLAMWLGNSYAAVVMVPLSNYILDQVFSTANCNVFLALVDGMKTVAETSTMTSPEDVLASWAGQEEEIVIQQAQGPQSSTPPSTDLTSEERSEVPAAKGNPATMVEHRYRLALVLGVACGCQLGSTGNMLISAPGLIAQEVVHRVYGNRTMLNYATWLVFNVPVIILCDIVVFLALLLFSARKKAFCMDLWREQAHWLSLKLRVTLRSKYLALGKRSYLEGVILFWYVILNILLLTQNRVTYWTWADFTEPDITLDYTSTVCLVLIIIFLFEDRLDCICCYIGESTDKPPRSAMSWRRISECMSWSTLLIMGGGIAVSEAALVSGLYSVTASQTWFSGFQNYRFLFCFVLSLVTSVLTEVMDNNAAAAIVVPWMPALAAGAKIHPLYLIIPTAVLANYSFGFSRFSPALVIAHEICGLRINQAIRVGLILKVLCAAVMLLLLHLTGPHLFHFNQYPGWAEQTRWKKTEPYMHYQYDH